MDFLALAREARTCRRFDESAPLSQQDLEWLLECARLAPSARNAQELRFITITRGPMLDKLFPLTRWAAALRDWHGPEPGERPTAFIAVLMPESPSSLLYIDAGIACQTIQLAAASRGWGMCMIHSFEHGEAADLLHVPSPLKIVLLLGIGKAVEKRVVANMPPDGSFAYWRDSAGVHHVPKRPLAELLIQQY